MIKYRARFRYKGQIVTRERLEELKLREMKKESRMKLSTTRQYVFADKTGELYIHSSEAVTTPHKTIETKVWVNVQNFIESKIWTKRKISVSNFNKLELKFIGEL